MERDDEFVDIKLCEGYKINRKGEIRGKRGNILKKLSSDII